MKRYKFKLFMERELFADGDTAEEARQSLIERLANDRDEFTSNGSDYIDDGVEES